MAIGGYLKYNPKVIYCGSVHEPALWTFFDYVTKSSNPIEAWLSVQPEGVQDLFNGLIKDNRKIDDPKKWGGSRKMKGALKESGIWEYRIDYVNVQYRLLGIFGHFRKQAIFLIGCTHKMKVYDPHNCLETAIKRARAIVTKEEGVFLHERKVQEDI